MGWFKIKEVCVHCRARTTWREFEGQPTCPECRISLLTGREGTRRCPVDGATLIKEPSHQILLDRCPECNGVWLDAGEIDDIKEAAMTEGFAVGNLF